MEDLSLHILDIVENSLRAEAKNISITIDEDMKRDTLEIKISDNGKGLSEEEIKKASDPFYTTKKGKKFGMGLALLAQSAREARGKCDISSIKRKGTKITATFEYSHIDRRPLGDITKTLMVLIASNPEVDFYFAHRKDSEEFIVDTKDIKKELDGIQINSPEILKAIRKGFEDFYKVSS